MKSNVLKNTNFRLLFLGQGLSMLGDQFEMIAMPWLVLKLTNDPLALGAVLAFTGIPRALFILVGGAVTDRFSSRTIMLVSDLLRLVMTAVLAGLVATGGITLPILYGFSLAFGLISGFFGPASNSMVPRIVSPNELQAGNSLIVGANQLSMFLGPMLAGGLIALFARSAASNGTRGMTGIALAFAFDSFTFLVSALTLYFLRLSQPDFEPSKVKGESIFTSIKTGIQFVMKDQVLRAVYLLVAAANLFFNGPLLVGMPVLANTRLPEGAAAFGLIMSAYGGGNLAGILLAGSLPRQKGNVMSAFLVALVAVFGICLTLFALIESTLFAFIILLVLGVGNGYLAIILITTLQKSTPRMLLGRMMSLVLLANFGLVPISQALSGWLIKVNMNGLFIGAGIAMLLLAVWLALAPESHTIGLKMAGELE